MGQYHHLVNLDKMEYLHPHKLGSGLKLWEQLASGMPGKALTVLLASASNGSGGGDLEPHPMVGHWRGDRIAMLGDYDDASSYTLGDGTTASGAEIYSSDKLKDITEDVCEVIENELGGKFIGDGWRDFKENAA